MSLHRFFLNKQILAHEHESQFVLDLDADDLHHARVLRLMPGEHIAVVDAATDYFECEVISLDEVLRVRIAQHRNIQPPCADVILVQGLAKGDKMDTIIRQTTELGISVIVPLIAHRSVVKLTAEKVSKRMQRWCSIAKSAAMQSGRFSVPHLFDPASVDALDFLLADCDSILVFWEEASATRRLRDILRSVNTQKAAFRIALIVGPEGGLSFEEVELLRTRYEQASLVTLGDTVLRTETAGVVATALTLYELGGLGNTQLAGNA